MSGTSVLGLTFDGGVMLAADTLGEFPLLIKKRKNKKHKPIIGCAIAAETVNLGPPHAEFCITKTAYVLRFLRAMHTS